jgi:hypothetical protein
MIEIPPALWMPPKPAIIRPRTPDLIPPIVAGLMLPMKVRQGNANQAVAGGAAHSNFIFQTTQTNTGFASSYTFSNQNIGTAAADRWVIVAVQSAIAATGATVGGVTATKIIEDSAPSTNIWAALVPTGTTASIVITFPSLTNGCMIGYWTVNMSTAAVAFDTAQNVNNSGPSVSVTGCDITANGFAVWVTCNTDGTDVAHSIDQSFVEDAEPFSPNGINAAFAHRELTGGASLTNATVTSTWTGSASQATACFASWA